MFQGIRLPGKNYELFIYAVGALAILSCGKEAPPTATPMHVAARAADKTPAPPSNDMGACYRFVSGIGTKADQFGVGCFQSTEADCPALAQARSWPVLSERWFKGEACPDTGDPLVLCACPEYDKNKKPTGEIIPIVPFGPGCSQDDIDTPPGAIGPKPGVIYGKNVCKKIKNNINGVPMPPKPEAPQPKPPAQPIPKKGDRIGALPVSGPDAVLECLLT